MMDDERWNTWEKWVIAAAAIIMLSLALFFGVRNSGNEKQVADLQEKIDILEVDRSQKQLTIDDLRKKITGLNQEVESLSIRYAADELYIGELESRYKSLFTYANAAEYLLIKMFGEDALLMNPELKPASYDQNTGVN